MKKKTLLKTAKTSSTRSLRGSNKGNITKYHTKQSFIDDAISARGGGGGARDRLRQQVKSID
jgi:hypothetical protein